MATATALFLGFIIVQRLTELLIARRDTARLLVRGARGVGAAHYPAMMALHATWIACLVLFGHAASISLAWRAVFAVLQGLRIWILVSLGERGTTRVIILDQPLVGRGPFRFVSHPNYMLMVAEIIVAPMVLGLVWVAALFTV